MSLPGFKKAVTAAAAALAAGTAKGISSQREPTAAAEDRNADVERQGVSDLERAAMAFNHTQSFANNASYAMTANELRRKGRGDEVPAPLDMQTEAPGGHDVD